ncbi:hypothetical protein JB92DRAFT_3093618 [Gautieria morchelliformis]|nr:hypothetical protein JB92DRAFT_3093618 [Gautieria morchelliformis]
MKAKCKGRGKENGKGKGKATVRKRVWPTHFHVCEVANGMQFIHNRRHQSGNTITSLFESFYGQEIKLSTFKLNRNLWNDKLPEELKRRFIAYGETRRGLWPKLLYAYHNDGNELMDHPDQVSTSSDNGGDTSSTGSCPSDNERGISKALDKRTSPDLPEASDLLKSSSLSKASSHSDAAASQDGLCCFCFLPLPPVLSPTLQSKLAELLLPANSLPDPTEDFPGGRRHCAGRGCTLHLEYCGGHFRQSEVSAKAIGQNWPKPADINYSTLPCRIESLHYELAKVVINPSLNILFGRVTEDFHNEGVQRFRSIEGIRRRMASEHAGYYGDQGVIIINREVSGSGCSRRAATAISSILCSHSHLSLVYEPLTYTNLSPILLIQSDTDCSLDVAIETWEASGEWGALHSPDDVNDEFGSDELVIKSEYSESRIDFHLPLPAAIPSEPGIDAEGNSVEVFIVD